MKQTKNQFILMDKVAFTKWLQAQTIKRKIKRIQNHHTWKPEYGNFKDDNHFKMLEGMKRSHLKRGFSNIAQNITTFLDGTIAICRPLNEIPAGIKGANTGGICIEHIGNFDVDGDKMSRKHKNTIVYINALLCQKFELNPDTDSLVYHHWWDLRTGKRKNGKGSTKSCPGTNFFGGNEVADAERHFIPKVITALKKIDSNYKVKPPKAKPAAESKFPISYAKKGKVLYGDKLQIFLNQFSGIKLKVDSWPRKKTSDAFKKVMGYYLVGDLRNK